tara:strand:+ start:750 stop:1523 length:774 start_codon:yes stop_codon:yes gene_type:complete
VKINKNKFKDWKSYYLHYQETLASSYYIPFLKNNGIDIDNKKILEIGCGNGGFIKAFSRYSQKCTGFDIKNLNWDDSDVRYLHLNIFDDNFDTQVSDKFDVIILRDVIEHIDNKMNDILFDKINSLSNENATILVTFPPFYSPFGLHQQALLGGFCRYVPFLSLIPKMIMNIIFCCRKNKDIDEMLSLYESGMTIRSFKKMINKFNYNIINQKFFTVRPSHELRYGLKTKESKLLYKIPILRELLITGTAFIIKKGS